MDLVTGILAFVLWLYLLLLIGRLVFDWVQVFARDWRPKGIVLVLAEVIYTATDPPLRLLRRVIPPLNLGQIRLDLGFVVLFLAVTIALQVVQSI
ncbi:YggT family protein [Cellulosimicrobium marinum]|uniref:YggT family protein n=1 Tax=Cellulosimicrobium marinum TaxID=1638992 RepID=UPI001E2EB1F5|nr:YggT family protein [Cellulosimicrobium marinum]MCB7137791.1 YggT family protein [Cellulosimicrobium marinum]